MSVTELWPVVDTALKIGIGSSLTLASIYVMHRYKSASDLQTPRNRRLEMYEQISAAVGNVNHAFAKYSALVIESTRFGKNWPVARKTELDRVNAELVMEFKKLADAEARLLMLGEKTMEKTLRLYGARIAVFRKQVYVGRQDISDQEIANLKADIMALREKFYDLLSKRYDRLLAA